MAYRELEVTLLSAQELKSVNLITRMDVYAVVSISGDPLTRQCTPPDIYGGRNPCWNATFRFAVPATAAAATVASASLHVLLRAERFLGDRDVGEVVVPLADILADATGVGPQPPKVASYQVRKLHRWEPRGVLNVSYRLGPIVAPVVERQQAPDGKAAGNGNGYFHAYGQVGVPQQPSYPYPTAAAYPAAAQKKSAVMAYPVGVPVPQQQASNPPAKPDAYHPPSPSPSPSPPPPRPAAVHAPRHDEAPARSPAPAAPAPPPTNERSNGFSQPGPTHVYMGPHSQIIFGSAGPPTRTTSSSARSIISPGPAGKNGDGNWASLHDTQRNWASSAESMSVSVISPRNRNEDRWRPSLLSQSHSQSQPDTQQQQAARSPVAAAPSPQRHSAASPFSSRSSSFSSPLSPYSGSAHPSPSSSSAHSATHSPYSAHPSTPASPKPQSAAHSPYAAYPSTPASPKPPSPTHSPYSAHPSTSASSKLPAASDAVKLTHGTNNNFRSNSRGGSISSPSPSSSPMVPNHSRGSAISSPLPSSSPRYGT